jgi:hypothetical protein
MYHLKHRNDEVLSYIEKSNGLAELNLNQMMEGVTFYEFDLSDLGLPSAETLLAQTLWLEKNIGLKGWKSNHTQDLRYKGFSLTYNPDFLGEEKSIYHQTWGSALLTQSYNRHVDLGIHTGTKDTYYDSYAFRCVPMMIKEAYSPLLDKLGMSLVRSRTAYQYVDKQNLSNEKSWHTDEYPYQVLRINIPLQTEDCYVIDIDGDDSLGNRLTIRNKHLTAGKAYIWNTKIPHKIYLNKLPKTNKPRIHIVLGLSPYFDYVKESDAFVKSRFFGQKIRDLIESRSFLK